jgi:hypothetical protein
VRRRANEAYAQLQRDVWGVSALHTVELEETRRVVGFLALLVSHDSAGSIALKSLALNIDKPSSRDVAALAHYLSRTNSLRDLRLGWSPQRRTISRKLTRAFRVNGSLVQVRLKDSSRDSNARIELESFCARNANLPLILAGYSDGGSCAERGSEPLSLVPCLLVAARQATRTAASTMLTGLLALSDSIPNERSDALRMRS